MQKWKLKFRKEEFGFKLSEIAEMNFRKVPFHKK